MVARKVVLFVGLLIAASTLSEAQEIAPVSRGPLGGEGTWEIISSLHRSEGFSQYMSLSKYLNSFTSYQFSNPFPPGQDPLSRLEFPIDQWFIGWAAAYEAVWWSLDLGAWVNVSRDSPHTMQDSDWDDETRPYQKTIFSESACRLDRGWLIDVRLALGNYGQGLFKVRPVGGYRRQYFHFTTYDGYQGEISGRGTDLPGDGIEFEQIFSQYYCGGCVELSIPIRAVFEEAPRIPIRLQLDYALVTAVNEDLHLLRQGERITTENTKGHCWHIALSSGVRVRNFLKAHIEADFKRIITHGDHRLTNPLFGIDFSLYGSRVWSDQASLAVVAELSF